MSQVSDLIFPTAVNTLKFYNNTFFYGTANSKEVKGDGGDEGSWVIMSKDLTNHDTVVKELDKEPLALVIYDGNSQKGSNACSHKNGGCQHLCVPVSESSVKCMCSVGYNVNKDDPTRCIPVHNFLMYAADGRIQVILLKKDAHNSKISTYLLFQFLRILKLYIFINSLIV